MIYADDILLLSASRNGLQNMVDISAEFARSKNIKFGTDPDKRKSKSKCIISSKKDIKSAKSIKLDGRDLPWVDQIKYLGCTLVK